MKIFEPLMTHSSPSLTAVVWAVDQRAEEALLLFLGPEAVDAGAAQGGMDGDGDAGAGIYLGDLLHAQRVGQGVAARAAVLPGIGDAEEAVSLQLRQQRRVVGLLLVHLLGQRLDLCFRKAAEHLLHQKMRLIQLKIHSDSSDLLLRVDSL